MTTVKEIKSGKSLIKFLTETKALFREIQELTARSKKFQCEFIERGKEIKAFQYMIEAKEKETWKLAVALRERRFIYVFHSSSL
jgi:hypothetical protein